MKVLIVGGGGREHALVWKIAQSPRVKKIFCAPGNAGISGLATCVPIGAEDVDKLLEFAKTESIDLTVVGPEGPLSRGIVDRFLREGLRIFGATQKAAARAVLTMPPGGRLLATMGTGSGKSLLFQLGCRWWRETQ